MNPNQINISLLYIINDLWKDQLLIFKCGCFYLG